jgi:hypothetical protein
LWPSLLRQATTSPSALSSASILKRRRWVPWRKIRSTSLAKARATTDSGQASCERRCHLSPASLVRAASATASSSRGTFEPLRSCMAWIARSSDTCAAKTFSATASKAGGSASSGKWRRGGAWIRSSPADLLSSAVTASTRGSSASLSLTSISSTCPAANSKASRTASRSRRGYDSTIRPTPSPAASFSRMSSTVRRVPATVGLPSMTPSSFVMPLRCCMSVVSFAPHQGSGFLHATTTPQSNSLRPSPVA